MQSTVISDSLAISLWRVCAHKQRSVSSALAGEVPLVTHVHLYPAGSRSCSCCCSCSCSCCCCSARCCARTEVAVAGSTALLRGKSNCLALKGDLNLCMKGSRVFALDFILAFYFYFLAFYFGFAFSLSFQPVLFSPLSRSSHEPAPAAPAPMPRSGQPQWG